MSTEVTGFLRRPVGLSSFADLTGTDCELRPNRDDGTATVVFPVALDASTAEAVRERMETRDDAELSTRQQVRAAVADLDAQAPLPDGSDQAATVAWLLERVSLLSALVDPLACLALGTSADAS